MNTTTHTITTKHFPSLYYRRIGNGPALMLLHGFPATGSLWDGVASNLASKFTLLIPDLPGAGQSRLEGETVSMEELATVVPAILDKEGLERSVIVGHSMGGYIGMAAAELFPERLTGLQLVHSTASADDEVKKEKRAKSIALIGKGGLKEFINGMIPALFEESFPKEHPVEVNELRQEGLKLRAESAIAYYNAMMSRRDRTDVLSQIAFPTGWIMGADDTTISWQNTLQQTSVPNVSFVRLYKRCGHMSMIEQPEQLGADLLNFANYCAQRSDAISK